MPSHPFDAIVVGAGPAGITALGSLLENKMDRILWVDDAFDGGRINRAYREVPSNTKVKLFVDFATAMKPFEKIISGPSASEGKSTNGGEDKLQAVRQLEQEKGCQLSHAADICLTLTQGLRKMPGVKSREGRVVEAKLDQTKGQWNVTIYTNSREYLQFPTKRLIFCTGSSPYDPPLTYEPPGLRHINLDTALSPTKLSQLLSPLGPTTIAVVGASHSAILVLMNLSRLALSTKPDLKIKWFTRHPLRYAEYEDGFIARDNTGLKGEAAVWARENLEPDALPRSPVRDCIERVAYKKGDERAVYEAHLPGCTFVVQAIGYAPDPLPRLLLAKGEGARAELVMEPRFDHDRGVFAYTEGRRQEDGTVVEELQPLPGVYGAGIAFPQRVVDRKYGHEEMNVGFFKFMKAVKGWVGGWKEAGAVGVKE